MTPNYARIAWDLRRRSTQDPTKSETSRFDQYWIDRQLEFIPRSLFEQNRPVWFEIGAGSGWFFVSLAEAFPESFLIAIERCRMRGNRLVKRARKAALPNLAAFRGNAIPALIHGVPSGSCDRVYLLYPAPWPKTSQRKNRWYLHPIMPHLRRILKDDGLLIWASDQRFYIEEAKYVTESRYAMQTLVCGELSINPYNDLERFPAGRTKFEASFLAQGLPCYELISRKNPRTEANC